MSVTPYQKVEASKKEQVTEMFDNIAPSYDLLNRALSFGVDITWRRKAVKLLKQYQPRIIVDIATGTGDFAIEARKLNPEKIIGIDISPEMLRIGEEKIKKRNLDQLIDMRIGDSESLQLDSDSVDAVTVGFGVRNFENLKQGMSEILRVLKPGGAVAILEPSFPTRFPLKQLFYLHFRIITPFIGKMISGDNAAYTYLPESVKAFPNGEEFTRICKEVGFSKAVYKPLTFGICSLYMLEK
ncbi:MAG: bifunctional demethylmenaquinone methyltransferase/2-methoxy-6-polyprenyl-1,4-benzoquinol methylase UbiE [Bacteroidetes bacterium]|nr:bifunctional demethylmenaquinone methyltransferase/2-methoxy-6-polyprenyl-1,4-benzoquinol methylase UbiE [Bacteroidota bacterium]MCB0842722.1 bifunctional demethylmenaquinone methyltransferase/2-methoxy-6-polyprenyl-1,4-benzoquinol methylase UbiE [Bacteroidota bacterium]